MYVLAPNAIIEKYPYSIGELRRDNSQTSFPAKPTDALLAEYNVFPVERTDIPVVDYTQAVTEVDPQLVDGVWVQTWTVTDRTAEEVAQIEADQWANVRIERNTKLAACDWTQLPDAPIDRQVWAIYRQALRDITDQADPFSIVWPPEPIV
jgi:hypothetical protein